MAGGEVSGAFFIIGAPKNYDKMLSIRAYAKINLYLDVISRYPDGYHQIESIMQSISLHDLVEISSGQDINISCTKTELSGMDNLAFRAASVLRDEGGIKDGASIHITKHIPVAAGLAGGSADAAATLIGLNCLWGLNLSLADLKGIGFKLGADVPFCLEGGTMLAEGKGERLTKLKPFPTIALVLVTPPVHVSTAEIYHGIDEEKPAPLGHKNLAVAATNEGDLDNVISLIGNLLETVALKRYPAISRVKQIGVRLGGLKALMSGSGPSVYVLCRDGSQAADIASRIKDLEPEYFVEVVWPVDRGVEVL